MRGSFLGESVKELVIKALGPSLRSFMMLEAKRRGSKIPATYEINGHVQRMTLAIDLERASSKESEQSLSFCSGNQ